MELYLLFRDEWESSDEPFLLPPNQIRQIIDESSKTESKTDDKEKNHNNSMSSNNHIISMPIHPTTP